MSSRSIQIVQIEQKIERLQIQLDYLRSIDQLEIKQTNQLQSEAELVHRPKN